MRKEEIKGNIDVVAHALLNKFPIPVAKLVKILSDTSVEIDESVLITRMQGKAIRRTDSSLDKEKNLALGEIDSQLSVMPAKAGEGK